MRLISKKSIKNSATQTSISDSNETKKKTKISNLQFIATLIHVAGLEGMGDTYYRDECGVPFKHVYGRSSGLSYTEILSMLQTWRGRPNFVNSSRFDYSNGKCTRRNIVRRNMWGTQYLSYAPFRGGCYKKVLWDSNVNYEWIAQYDENGEYTHTKQGKLLSRHYFLLPRAKKYIVPAKSIQDLMDNYEYSRSAGRIK